MTSAADQPARNINSVRPFKRAVWRYREKNWLGTIILPPREKHPPPLKSTGRGAAYPTNEQIGAWLDGDIDWLRKPEFRNADYRKANIGLHLGPVPNVSRVGDYTGQFEIVGLDVDDYTEGEKVKVGGAQLAELEAEYGVLPPTWRSSSREGISGIRFYLVPAGLAFRGKAADHIDVIQAVHRFAVVFPSYHPSGGQYVWYRPDPKGGMGTRVDALADIPDATTLPLLPDAWIDYLTRSRTRDEGVPMDMDTSSREIMSWARKRFVTTPKDGPRLEHSGMCRIMRKAVGDWKIKINDDPSSHDKISGMHWNLLRNGMEGHSGWPEAVAAVETYIQVDVKSRNKRSLSELKSEFFRSKTNALRKIKGEVDLAKEESGIDLISQRCNCFDDDLETDSVSDDAEGPGVAKTGITKRRVKGKSNVAKSDGEADRGSDADTDQEVSPVGEPLVADGIKYKRDIKAPNEYEMTDDGNAEHWLDLLGGASCVHWVKGWEHWVIWSEDQSRWLIDSDGLAHRTFEKVKRRQFKYAENLRKTAETHANAKRDAESKTTSVTANNWQKWAVRSGSNLGADAALTNAKRKSNVTIDSDALDANRLTLGVGRSVLELNQHPNHDAGEEPWTVREARKEDLLTLTTGLDVLAVAELDKRGVALWQDYLDTFIPDINMRHFVQKIFGYSLLGVNNERLCVFLHGDTSTGKSTMLAAAMAALGDYASTVEMSAFRETNLNPGLAAALGKRLITLSEVSSANRMHADVFKRITGGEGEVVSAQLKYKNDLVRRVPAFLPIIGTNSPPTISGADAGLKRRLCVIPFNHQVTDKQDDRTVTGQIVRHCGPVVLRWLVDGWAMYVNEGLERSTWPRGVRSETDDFHSALSDIGDFLRECTIKKPGALVPVANVYAEYLSWCELNSISTRERLTAYGFGRMLKQNGIKSDNHRVGVPGQRSKPVRCYEQIALRAEKPVRTLKKRRISNRITPIKRQV